MIGSSLWKSGRNLVLLLSAASVSGWQQWSWIRQLLQAHHDSLDYFSLLFTDQFAFLKKCKQTLGHNQLFYGILESLLKYWTMEPLVRKRRRVNKTACGRTLLDIKVVFIDYKYLLSWTSPVVIRLLNCIWNSNGTLVVMICLNAKCRDAPIPPLYKVGHRSAFHSKV